MNRYPVRIALLCVGMSVAQTSARSQTAPAPDEEQPVVLPQFVIHETPNNPYQSGQALSTSRVAMSIQDIPQTVSVVTQEFIKDSMSFRMLDAAKYVTPIVESTLPYGGDRYMIRGFQVSQEFVDGSSISGGSGYSMSIPQYNIERIEVIKGPNAILVPGGSPGGVMNPITKEPMAKDATTLSLSVAQYNGNDVGLDVNRVVNDKNHLAFRFVAGVWRNTHLYIKNHYRNGYEISPSLSVELSPALKLIVKADFLQNRETNLGGVPIDPSIGSNQVAVIARGLPRDWSFGNDDDSRHRSTERVSAELRTTMGAHVTSRLYVMGDHVRRIDLGGTGAALATGTAAGRTGGGSRNPSTGLYEPGVNWTTTIANGVATPASTVVPVTDPSTWVYTRNNGKVDLEYEEAHLKNDYAAVFESSWFKSTTLGGLAADFSKVRFLSWGSVNRGDVANNNLSAIGYAPYNMPQITPSTFSLPNPTSTQSGGDVTARTSTMQAFIFETFKMWNDRLQLSGGLSRFYGNVTRTDSTLTSLNATILNNAPSYSMTTNAKTMGIVFKPIKEISLFASRNTTGGAIPNNELGAGTYLEKTTTYGPDFYHATATVVQAFRPTSGSQDEFGVKTSAFNGKLTASAAYFKISQQNYGVPNSEYYTLVAQGNQAAANALQNPIYLDLAAKGWEFETTYSPIKNITILANYTSFKERQPITDVRVRGVPDHAGAIYVDYRFTEGALAGFGINVGADYKSDVAGENVNAFTTNVPVAGGLGLVPQQPSFLVGGRTVVNVGFSYRRPAWTVRILIANALDEDYIQAAGSRTSAIMADPRNIKGSFSYTF